ncbi:MAG: SDR family NAD(P)-dependent oxidoreductase [Clostridia bacterium]|nr:SDR family NAD(P)-dependent oxidoreductase [Clostridia bacterium]
MRIEKRTIVITGASSGIGLGLKEKFEKKGDVVIDVSLNGADYQCDVADHKQLKAVFDDIYLNHGEIDILVTCAGYGISGAIELLKEEDTKKQFDVNFFGTANACKYAIPMMKKKGKMVIIASATALFPLPFKAYYCASKAAVDSFAQSLRMELSRTKIQVTSICPGDIKTNFSNNRVKVYETNERYGNSIELSTKPTEKTEKRRMPPEYAVKKLMKICEKKHFKPRYIIGKQYKFFNVCRKVFTTNRLNKFITKIFYKK